MPASRQPLGHHVPVHPERPAVDPHDVQMPGVRVRRRARRQLEAADAAELRVVARGDGRPALLPGLQTMQLFAGRSPPAGR